MYLILVHSARRLVPLVASHLPPGDVLVEVYQVWSVVWYLRSRSEAHCKNVFRLQVGCLEVAVDLDLPVCVVCANGNK